MYIGSDICSIINLSNTGEVIRMTIQERIRLSSVLEEVKRYKNSAEKCGLRDVSSINILPKTQNNTGKYPKK